jgi:predicted PurR-regulated permease PerM
MMLRSDHLQSAWWLAVAACILWVLWLLGPILTPFLAGAVLAYILDPGVEWLVRRRIPRTAAAALVLALGFVAILAVFLIVAPLIRREATELTARVPDLLDRLDKALAPWLEATLGREVHVDFASLKALLTDQLQASEGLFGRLLASARSGGMALVGWLGTLVLIPVVLFYLLVDWNEIVARVDRLVPRRFHERVQTIAGEIDAVLSEFLRGQLAVMGLLAAYYAVALWLGGIEFSLPIALVAGGLAFVPYLGFGTGLVLALLAAAVQDHPVWNLVVVAVVFGLGQLLESFLLTPRIVGQRIGLHPVAVVFALLAFGHVFGFVGVLLALPASAVLLVGLRHLKDAYFASPFYRDAEGRDAASRDGSSRSGVAGL